MISLDTKIVTTTIKDGFISVTRERGELPPKGLESGLLDPQKLDSNLETMTLLCLLESKATTK